MVLVWHRAREKEKEWVRAWLAVVSGEQRRATGQ